MSAFVSTGTEIAHYRIKSLIGRGGMAFVYHAEDLRLQRPVALKILAPELSESEDFRKRFFRESRFAAGLEHPNIIPIYEAGDRDGLLYLAMRYCPEGDLDALLAKNGRLGATEAVPIAAQVAAALDAAHAVGLVHRDVKPANILIGSWGDPGHPPHVYLSDFGLIKRPSSLSAVTATGHFLGTANFAAPEQIRGEPADPRTDLYQLGCVLYQCLTGAAPFVREDQAALLWAHLTQAPPPLASFQANLAAIDPIVAKALAKSPDDRYESCGQFAIALGQALTGAASDQAREQVTPAHAAADVNTIVAAQPDAGSAAAGVGTSSAFPDSTAPPAVLGSPPALPPPRPPLDPAAPADQPAAGDADQAGIGRRLWPVVRPTDRGHRGSRPRPTRILIPVAAAAVLALLGTLGVHSLRSAGTPASGRTATASAPPPTCTVALDAANRSIDQGQRVDAAFNEHSNVMHQQDIGQLTAQQAFDMGRPALTKGAAASAEFDQVLPDYQRLAGACRSATASATPCTPAIDAADQALGHAQQLEAALREHTDVMNQLDYGKITAAQATQLGMASLTKGHVESTQFEQALTAYRSLAGTCR